MTLRDVRRMLAWSVPVTTQSLPAPTALRSPLASSSAVQLTWTGAGPFVVERRADAKTFATIGRTSDAAYTDAAIDPFATYVYRIRTARGADGGPGGEQLSPPSNEITVGPPPAGFSTVVKAAKGKEGDFASHIAVALDGNGDPAIAYMVLRADDTKAHLHFVAWNRATYQWRPPVRVAVAGSIDAHLDDLGVSLARDASTGTLLIAYQTGDGDGRGVSLAASIDAGSSWKTETIRRPDDSEQRSGAPTVVAADGVTHLAYLDGSTGVRYGSRRGSAGAFASAMAPIPDGYESSRANAGLVLDGNLQPALFYWYNAKDGPRSVVGFWRPGQAQPVPAVVSDTGSDDGFASLAFAGTAPRLLVSARRDDDFEDHLWFTSSTDGKAWPAPIKMPKDDQDFWSLPLSLAMDSKGRAAATITITTGRGASLGRPKMLRSNDLRAWCVWSPDTARVLMGVSTVGHVIFAANDKQYVVFTNDDPGRKLPAGIALWREP